MKKLIFLGVVASIALLASVRPASAQTIPNLRGLTPYTAETNFMSLPGYLRWQYFTENHVWISRAEATALANSQTSKASG